MVRHGNWKRGAGNDKGLTRGVSYAWGMLAARRGRLHLAVRHRLRRHLAERPKGPCARSKRALPAWRACWLCPRLKSPCRPVTPASPWPRLTSPIASAATGGHGQDHVRDWPVAGAHLARQRAAVGRLRGRRARAAAAAAAGLLQLSQKRVCTACCECVCARVCACAVGVSPRTFKNKGLHLRGSTWGRGAGGARKTGKKGERGFTKKSGRAVRGPRETPLGGGAVVGSAARARRDV